MWSVERVEGGFAVCENETGARREIPLGELPPDLREGELLRETGTGFVRAAQETEARRKSVFRQMKRLFGQDKESYPDPEGGEDGGKEI